MFILTHVGFIAPNTTVHICSF